MESCTLGCLRPKILSLSQGPVPPKGLYAESQIPLIPAACLITVVITVFWRYAGADIEKGWYGIAPAARAGSSTENAQHMQRPNLASRMARLRGFTDIGSVLSPFLISASCTFMFVELLLAIDP